MLNAISDAKVQFENGEQFPIVEQVSQQVELEREDTSVSWDEHAAIEIRKYIEWSAVFPELGYELHEVPTTTLASKVRDIVTVESPVHFDDIVTRIRSMWGLKRAGARIKAAVERAASHATNHQGIIRKGYFFWKDEPRITAPRKRSEGARTLN
ncbi:MAG: DUF3320 domain-containing protein [bacterium]